MNKYKAFIVNFILLQTFHTQSTLSQVPNEDTIVGVGLLAPLMRTANNILTAPIKNQARLARNRARMRHRHLLRAENPVEDNGPVIEGGTIVEKNWEEPKVRNGDLNSNGNERVSKKIKNNKRDEEYYLWSLNNWVPYGRAHERSTESIAIDNIYEYNKGMYQNSPEIDVKLLANPSFYRNYQVVPTDEEIKNIIPPNFYFDGAPLIEITPQQYNEDNSIFYEDCAQIEVVPENCGGQETYRNQQGGDNFEDGTRKNQNIQENTIVPQKSYHFINIKQNGPEKNIYNKEEQSKLAEYTSNLEQYNNPQQNKVVPQGSFNYINNILPIPQPKVLFNTEEHYRSADPRHFHVHHHSTTVKKLFPHDKPIYTQSSSFSHFEKQPQIVINNHNVPVNVYNQNSQIAQTSGHSTSTQSQLVPHINTHKLVNLQGASSSQAIKNDWEMVPSPLFALTNNQLAKTIDASTANQVQTIQGTSGQNNQFSLTSGGSESTQSQSVNFRDALLGVPSPYLIDVPTNRRINRRFNRRKRSLPLVRLITDPNAKLDMPKTLENFGTVARNSFHDKRHPMYHMKNMVGSARDVFLSALRVPPQGIVIPSQYKIIDMKKERAVPFSDYRYMDNVVQKARSDDEKIVEPFLGTANVQKAPQTVKEKIQERLNNLRNNLGPKVKSRSILMDDRVGDQFHIGNLRSANDQFIETFQKMGNIFRESVQSGQQTLNHITDAAHSARKALTTSTLGAPRVVRPLIHATAFEKKRNGDPERVTFVTPRFLDVTNDGRPKETVDDFVGVGDIMNALGVSNPRGRTVGLRRYIVQSSTNAENPIIANRFGAGNDLVKDTPPAKKKFFIVTEDIDDNDVTNEMDIIEDLTDVLGVNSLKELLNGMKTDLTYMKSKSIENKYKELDQLQEVLNKIEKHDDDDNENKLTAQSDQTTNKISSCQDINTTPPPSTIKNDRTKRQISPHHQQHGLSLPSNLLRPFMGSPSRLELNNYFRQHGDFEEDLTSEEVLQSQQDRFVEVLLDPNEYIGAINPKLFMEMFNEPLTLHVDKYPKLDEKRTEDMVQNHNVGTALEDGGTNGRISMTVKDKLLKPHLGKKDKNHNFYDRYIDYVPDFGYYGGYHGNQQYNDDSSEEYVDFDK